MKINRNKFIQHLNRLACAGQVTEVVFYDGFAATALAPDRLLLVDVPEFDGAEPLEAEIGVANLDRFQKALRLLTGEGNTGVEVDIYVKDNRLVIDDGGRGKQELLLAAPKLIATRIEGATADKMFQKIPAEQTIALTRGILEGVEAAYSLYKPEKIEIQVSRLGGKIFVGTDKTDRAQFDLDVTSKTEYTLSFGKHLVDVFSVITDFSSAQLQLGGPDQPILVIDGEYTYMVSPRADGEKAKPAVKQEKEGTGQAEPAPEEPKARNRGRRARAAAES